jgi:hypothetical protein
MGGAEQRDEPGRGHQETVGGDVGRCDGVQGLAAYRDDLDVGDGVQGLCRLFLLIIDIKLRKQPSSKKRYQARQAALAGQCVSLRSLRQPSAVGVVRCRCASRLRED